MCMKKYLLKKTNILNESSHFERLIIKSQSRDTWVQKKIF